MNKADCSHCDRIMNLSSGKLCAEICLIENFMKTHKSILNDIKSKIQDTPISNLSGRKLCAEHHLMEKFAETYKFILDDMKSKNPG